MYELHIDTSIPKREASKNTYESPKFQSMSLIEAEKTMTQSTVCDDPLLLTPVGE
jgi:hypothetical protein